MIEYSIGMIFVLLFLGLEVIPVVLLLKCTLDHVVPRVKRVQPYQDLVDSGQLIVLSPFLELEEFVSSVTRLQNEHYFDKLHVLPVHVILNSHLMLRRGHVTLFFQPFSRRIARRSMDEERYLNSGFSSTPRVFYVYSAYDKNTICPISNRIPPYWMTENCSLLLPISPQA
jgi:hypothetical protein